MHFCYVVSLSEKTLCVRPSAAASATHLETKHVPYKRHRAKRVKLVILDNKSRLKVRVAMVTVLKPVSAEISQISYRFLLGAPCPPQPLRWVAVAETVDPSLPSAILTHQLAFWSSSPSSGAFMPEHFYYWALLHSSVSGCSVIRGGRPQRH